MFALVFLAVATQINVNVSNPPAYEIKLDPFVVKLIKPDANDTALLKLQKARPHARALYMAKWKEVIDIGASSVAYFYDEVIREQRELWNNLAELATTPEDKIKCAEMHVADMKWIEKVITKNVEVGAFYSHYGNFAKAARLDAEIDLLKLKEALKAGK
jgi:hypothetical protein